MATKTETKEKKTSTKAPKKVATKTTKKSDKVSAAKKTLKKKSVLAGKSLKSKSPKAKSKAPAKTSRETINIFFAATDNYIKYMDVAITSLIENASKDFDYRITVLHNGLSKKNEEILKKHETSNIKIDFRDVEEELKGLRDILPDAKIFSMATFYRLLIEVMYPNIDKAIYLDGDIVVVGDISNFYKTNLENNLIGAVNEQMCFLNPFMTQYTIDVDGIDPHKFFNAGVMLLDLNAIREFELHKKFVRMLKDYNFQTPMNDQEYLNIICRNRIKLLPNGWNKEYVEACPLEGDLYLRHYALSTKPWKSKDVADADLWWNYAKKSAYYDELNEEYSRVTPEDLARDQMMAGKVFELAGQLMNSDHTFKKLIIDIEDR